MNGQIKEVTKGVIIAAGYGYRFLPFTKTIPKEMIPLIDKPSIDFIVEEFINSGITEILIVTSRRKKALEDYFDREIELETVFKAEGSLAKLDKIKPFPVQISFIRQMEMRGTGHAMLLARSFAGDDPIILAYPDDIHFGQVPLARQLIEPYQKTGCSVLASLYDPPDLNRYGVMSLAADGLHVTDIVEKPPAGQEPSREASIGRFLFTAEMFTHLAEGWNKHERGEYYHTCALKKLAAQGKLVFKRTEGLRLDTGEPTGYLRALIEYARSVPELRAVLTAAGLHRD